MADKTMSLSGVPSAKKIKNLWILLSIVEVFVAVIGITTLLMIFVPKARLELMKTPVGQFLMGLYGRSSLLLILLSSNDKSSTVSS